MTRIRTWVIAATTRGTNHYTITAAGWRTLSLLPGGVLTLPVGCTRSPERFVKSVGSPYLRGGGLCSPLPTNWRDDGRLESAHAATADSVRSTRSPSPTPEPWHSPLLHTLTPSVAVVAEWLRRLTRNQFPSGSVGSSPTDCGIQFLALARRATHPGHRLPAPTLTPSAPTPQLPKTTRGV